MTTDIGEAAVLTSAASDLLASAEPAAATMAGSSPRSGSTLSANTRRAYAADWRAFTAWCHEVGVCPLPSSPPVVARYLASLTGSLGRSGVRRRLAAIVHAHRRAGEPWDAHHPAIAGARAAMLAVRGEAARPAAVLTSAEVRQLVDACGSDLAGHRDRALLLLGFAGALRRSELVAIDRENLCFTPEGLSLLMARAGAGGEGEEDGTTLRIAHGQDASSCPVRTLEEWLRRTRIEYGAVFRRISAGGALEGRLTPQGVWRVLRKRAEIAQLRVPDGKRLSPHGLRAGASSRARREGARDPAPGGRHLP